MAVDDSYTKVLLHFDGDDASTTFTDESGKIWTPHGSAQLDIDQKKFGTASAIFNNNAGTYIDTPYHSDFNLGNSDWSIDFWIRIPNLTYEDMIEIGTDPNAISVYLNNYMLTVRIGGAYVAITTPGISADTQTHIAVVKVNSTNVLRVFVDGVEKTSGATSTTHPTIATSAKIGVVNTQGYGLQGHIDELRISKDIARWTSNFTPPTQAYAPEIAGEITDGVGLADIIEAISLGYVFSEEVGLADTIDAFSLSDEITAGVGLADTFEAIIILNEIIAGVGLSDTIDASVFSDEITDGIGLADTYDAEIYVLNVLNQNLPVLTCAAEGTVRSGVLEQDLPMFTISATGQGGSVGRLTASLPKLQISASGLCSLEGVEGNLGVTLPALTISASGLCSLEGVEGNLGVTLPALTISASGLCGQVGNLDQLLPLFTISATGYTKVMGNADLDLPMFYIYASGHQTAAAVVAADYLVLAMNPKNMAVSEYDWSGFNSFVYFNGVYLGAKAGTIHVLGGDDDSGSIIESEIELGQIPVDLVKPRDVYVLGRADGMMALTVQADEDTEKEVNIAYMLETLNLDRAKIPRGLQPTYFSLKLENKNGSDFDIDEIQVWGEIISR